MSRSRISWRTPVTRSVTSLPKRVSSPAAAAGSITVISNIRPAMRVSASLRRNASVLATPIENSSAPWPELHSLSW